MTSQLTLPAGTRFGPYEIVAPLGAGGMGEVYRAKDTRLGREVAIKVLPSAVASDQERLARFEREAKIVSSLNHPHIVTLHEIGSSDRGPYLVLEKIDGRSLRELLRDGRLPVRRILAIAAQIAEGLAKAHAAGIVHRDLKPENVMVTADGFAKILDFGLARLVWPALDENASGDAVTISNETTSGMILGTIGYLSPEQASGKPADYRADQFALGALLYEMASGERPFRRESRLESLTATIREEPEPLRSKRPDLPPQLGWLIERCLAKDPEDRYASTRDLARDLADLRDHLSEIGRAESLAGPPHERRWLKREMAAWVLAAVALATIGTLLVRRPQPAAPNPDRLRATILPPPNLQLDLFSGIALSPDGRKLLFVAGNALWLRTLDELAPRKLPGTDGAWSPFWSPDSQTIGFFARGGLLRIGIGDASSAQVCEAPIPRGGTWGPNGVILFGTNVGPLRKVLASGGTVTEVAGFDARYWNYRSPFFLPDGRHFLYTAHLRDWNTAPLELFLGSLDGGSPRRLGESWSNADYAAPGFVLTVQPPARTLVARRLDIANGRLTGDAISIASGLALIPGRWTASFSASATGELVYVTGGATPVSLPVWTDRAGRELGAASPAARYGDLALSPDGRRGVATIEDDNRGTADLWDLDLERQTRTRLTDTPNDEHGPIWTHDGQEIVYAARRRGSNVDLIRRRPDARSEEKLVLGLDGEGVPCDVSPDGRWLLYAARRRDEQRFNLWLVPWAGGEPRAFHVDRYPKDCGQISPDGQWVLSESEESGFRQSYVEPFPGPGRRYQIAKGVSFRAKWSPKGDEIYYFDQGGRVLSVTFAGGSAPVLGTPRVLFEDGGDHFGFGVRRDGQRFLRLLPDPTATAPVLTLLSRWLPESRR